MSCLDYHRATKHTPESVWSSAPPLDWANMPNPFRHYEGAPLIDLPADPPPPPVSALGVLDGTLGPPSQQDPVNFLSQLLFYSASISAVKSTPSGYRYALRVNPSSGNLHPTEFHLASRQGIFHYRVSSHMLEQRAAGDFGDPAFLLTTIAWREAWKYGRRAYRYCLLDAGHAWQALALSANAYGCEAEAIGHFPDDEVSERFRLPDDEWPLLLIRLKRDLGASPKTAQEWIGGVPNQLSDRIVDYPAIAAVHASTKVAVNAPQPFAQAPWSHISEHPAGKPFGEVVRQRRSALDFRGGSESMSADQLLTLLRVATHFLSQPYVNLYAYVHRVDGLAPGLYFHVRESNRLELVKPGDQRSIAAHLSLGQNLAGNSCVTFSMIADLERAIADSGDRGYRYVHFEAGAIGQRLYLAAESLGLQSTGIGAFYDDHVHDYLGLRSEERQVVYHFACGHAIEDHRLGTTNP